MGNYRYICYLVRARFTYNGLVNYKITYTGFFKYYHAFIKVDNRQSARFGRKEIQKLTKDPHKP